MSVLYVSDINLIFFPPILFKVISLKRDDGKWKSKNETDGDFGVATGTSRYHYADLGSNIQHTMHRAQVLWTLATVR